jgi:hypothetical protein
MEEGRSRLSHQQWVQTSRISLRTTMTTLEKAIQKSMVRVC